jgi:ribosomal protein S17
MNHMVNGVLVEMSPEKEAQVLAQRAQASVNFAAITRNSHKARLRGKAATASRKGDTVKAMQLLLQANEE